MRQPGEALEAAGWRVGARVRGAGIAYELEVEQGGQRGWATVAPPAADPVPTLREELALLADGIAPLSLVELEADEWSLIVEAVPRGPRATERPAAAGTAIAVGRTIAAALAQLHVAGRLALGLRPERVVLADSGAIVVAPRAEPFVARARPVSVGVPPLYPDSYLAFERIQGKPPGPPSDVYALAATVYRLATGQHPFEGAGPQHLMAIASGRVRPTAAAFAAAPALERVIVAALGPNAEARPSLVELTRALSDADAG